MSQVYGFVQQFKGGVHVHSELGAGTQIALYLPRHDQEVSGAARAIENSESKYYSGTESILVVDDEPLLLDFAKELLSSQGYQVYCRGSAQEALISLEQNKVDLVLTDVIMSGMNGYELAARIQINYPAIKVQLVSGYSDKRYSDFFNQELYDKRLQKPYSKDELLIKMRSLLDE